jgi:hypothetical protein
MALIRLMAERRARRTEVLLNLGERCSHSERPSEVKLARVFVTLVTDVTRSAKKACAVAAPSMSKLLGIYSMLHL